MDAEKSGMIDKIMKLLELGKDERGHEGERSNANDMAARLMAKHSIDFADLRAGKKEFNFTRQKIRPMDDSYCAWEGNLFQGLADAFDCKVVHFNYRARDTDWSMDVFGTKSDIEIATFFYMHLRRTIGRKAELSFKKKADVETYAMGMVVTINQRLKDLYQRRQDIMESDSRALVVVKTDGVAKFVSAELPNVVSFKVKSVNGSSESYQRGKTDGQNVNLSRPIANTDRAPMRTIRGH
jgi:hypothetical protein